ncbi:MAG TPA: sigma-54 dependent transcriptional regulator [Pirellulaceae bacterium]|nr:sigma-54-dependent Fis family transcriptional regulator [Planctomycetales bacterium]HRX78846.1 sigma-54 dependent transcriptional regulator [Pirellulaceae bacterium]
MTNVATPATTGRVLVVDDHARARESMADILECAGYRAQCCSSAVEALRKLDAATFDVIITDLRMPGMTGLEFIHELSKRHDDAQVVMVTAHASVTTAVDAMRHGAFDYIEKPFNADQLEDLVGRAMRHGAERRSSVPAATEQSNAMVGSSQVMQQLRQRIAQVAPTGETVLITGESGVGKELVAKAIHAASQRSHGPMVSLNCPALSPQLMESELFGHERGAFTNADAPRVGRFELADKGTILLDEVTEISMPLQAKLLRVLQEKSFERVGSSDTQFVDVRVLATSNRDLHETVQDGEFREDLYYRLAVVPIHVPPLRSRREDIPELLSHFLRQAATRLGKAPCEFAPSAIDLLHDYIWPGNVREVENLTTRASVLNLGTPVTADELRGWLMTSTTTANENESNVDDVRVGTNLADMERRLIEATLEHYGGHRAQTANALGIGIRTLTNKMRAYGYAPRTKSFARAA